MSRFGSLEFDNESAGEFRDRSLEKDERYYYPLARGAFEEADFEKALRLFSKVLEFNPNHTEAWSGQVRALIELEEYREAKLWADKALERFPHDPELLAAKGVALGRCGEQETALAFSDAALEERGDTPYVWLARGDVLLAAKERRADYCLEKALALAPGDWVVAWLAARIHYYYEQFSLGLKLAQQALEWNATQAVVWLQVGLCQWELGLAGPARHPLQQARQLNPRCYRAEQAWIRFNREGGGLGLTALWRRLFRK